MAQINKPNTYFNTILYTGDGTDPRAITGVGFQPDFVWNKPRSSANSHALLDSVRGATKFLSSDVTDAEYTYTNSLQSFDSDGFTCGGNFSFNQNTVTYVSWNFLASNTTASNTDGSITSTVSANTTSGFSIVSYTGTGANATVGHGLGSAPAFIIVKSRSSTDWWITYHKSNGATKYMPLNFTNAVATNSGIWNDTEPTSSVFSIGTNGGTNGSGNNYIAYCFAEKKGFSKFGSYTGNGNADGTFIYTGFKPAWIMRKDTTQINEWTLIDSTRSPFNQTNQTLVPNASDIEDGDFDIDILSNGFKCRTSESAHNQSGVNYIYMAFAENPLVGTNNIPATAR